MTKTKELLSFKERESAMMTSILRLAKKHKMIVGYKQGLITLIDISDARCDDCDKGVIVPCLNFCTTKFGDFLLGAKCSKCD